MSHCDAQRALRRIAPELASAGALNYTLLAVDLFANGEHYWTNKHLKDLSNTYVLHTNYVIGLENKINRLQREQRLWFIDDSDHGCIRRRCN